MRSLQIESDDQISALMTRITANSEKAIMSGNFFKLEFIGQSDYPI